MFGCEEVRTTVEVRAEADAIFSDFAQRVEREDLESARVSEHGAWPTDEAMQAAHAANGLVTGTQVEVIGVAENDLGAERFEDILRDCLDRSLGTDGHEDGRLDGLVREDETGTATAGSGFSDELEGRSHFKILAGQTTAQPCLLNLD